MFWAMERDTGPLARDLDRLAVLSGPGFVRGDLGKLKGPVGA